MAIIHNNTICKQKKLKFWTRINFLSEKANNYVGAAFPIIQRTCGGRIACWKTESQETLLNVRNVFQINTYIILSQLHLISRVNRMFLDSGKVIPVKLMLASEAMMNTIAN